MKTLLTGIVMLCVYAVPAHAQELTVSDALATRERAASGGFSARAEWTALGYYLQGVIEGMAGYQHGLLATGNSALFCPPTGKSYAVDEIFRFLDRADEADASRPASLVIVESYADAFPCDG